MVVLAVIIIVVIVVVALKDYTRFPPFLLLLFSSFLGGRIG